MFSIKNVLSNRIVKNSGWLIGEKIIQMIISLFVGLFTARYLGPANYGLISYAVAYIAFFSVFCSLGINSIIVKEFVYRTDCDGEIIGTVMLLKTIAAFLSLGAIFSIVSIVERDDPTAIAVILLSSVGLLFETFNTFNYWFQRQLKSKYTAMATLIAYIATATYRVFLMVSGKSVEWFALANSIDYICVAVFLIIAYKRCGGTRLSFSWEYARELLSRSKHFIFSGFVIAIYNQTDKVMLKHMLDAESAGHYSIACNLNIVWCFVLSAIIDSVYPSIVEAFKSGDKELFKERNRMLYRIVFYVSIVVAILFNIFADVIIYILYGETYMPSVSLLRIVSWLTAFSYLGVARNAWIACKERQKTLKYIYILAALSNIILNLILIPLAGASGAAIASLISQILTSIVLPFFMKDLRENSILMLEAIVLKGIKKEK